MKNVLFGFSSRLDTAEERISALDHILKKKKKLLEYSSFAKLC